MRTYKQNNVYFDGGHVRVVYDTLAFGLNVANTGLFDVSFCPEFTNNSYCLYNVSNINHNTLDILSGLDFEPNQLPQACTSYELFLKTRQRPSVL